MVRRIGEHALASDDFLEICAFNAHYASLIDEDRLEQWPQCFVHDCHYRITNAQNLSEGLEAGLIYASSRAMLSDRVSALRQANIYERQRYRHIIGLPLLAPIGSDELSRDPEMKRIVRQANANDSPEHRHRGARTPFVVVRIMQGGETTLFASGVYHDVFERRRDEVLLLSRIVVCDSVATDTLLALPL